MALLIGGAIYMGAQAVQKGVKKMNDHRHQKVTAATPAGDRRSSTDKFEGGSTRGPQTDVKRDPDAPPAYTESSSEQPTAPTSSFGSAYTAQEPKARRRSSSSGSDSDSDVESEREFRRQERNGPSVSRTQPHASQLQSRAGQMQQYPGQMQVNPGQMEQYRGQQQYPGQQQQFPGQQQQYPGHMQQNPGQIQRFPGQMQGQYNNQQGGMNIFTEMYMDRRTRKHMKREDERAYRAEKRRLREERRTRLFRI